MMKRYTFTTQDGTIDKLRALSKLTRIPVSRHLEEAIVDLFKKYEQLIASNEKE